MTDHDLQRQIVVRKPFAWWKVPLYTLIGLFALIGLVATVGFFAVLGGDGY